jgi:large repetitive protein
MFVDADGNGTLSYVWRFNGNPMAGKTSRSLGLGIVTPAQAGMYDCVVTNRVNGISTSVTSNSAEVIVISEPAAPTLTVTSAVLTNSTGHGASTQSQAGVTYTWVISHGVITAGAGSNEITFSAQGPGRIQLALTVSNLAGAKTAVRNILVADALPLDTIFAQQTVHPGTGNIRASAPDAAGQTYAWTPQNGSASISVTSSTTSATLAYTSGSATGSYSLALNSIDEAQRTTTVTRTLSVATNVFLKDPRDASPRSLHTATLLHDGRVLIAGGDAGVPDNTLVLAPGSQSRVLDSVELFDPATRTFASVASLAPRLGHTATLLNDGRVLHAGGTNGATAFLGSSQIFDPKTRTWATVGALNTPRAFHVATPLADGRVFVVGGVDVGGALAAAEIYDPVAETWTPVASMNTTRVMHSATRMRNGKILVVGGRNGSSGNAVRDSAEIYDPVANQWHAAAAGGQGNATGAVLLPSGKVLQLPNFIYDPALDTWELSVLHDGNTIGTSTATATLLPDGRVVGTGSFFYSNSYQPAIYDPAKHLWDHLSFYAGGSFSTTTALTDGKIFELGGIGRGGGTNYQSLALAAVLDPSADARVSLGSGAHIGASAAAARLADGRVLIAGGYTSRSSSNPSNPTTESDIFDPATNQWARVAPMLTARGGHTATKLATDQILVVGGHHSQAGVLASAERYDPQTNTWQAASGLSIRRHRHTASVLNDGRVLVAGGSDSTASCSCTTFQSAADLYDAVANSWNATDPLITARYDHTATRLPDGRVLVVGGFGGIPDTLQASGAVLDSAEIYDPTSGTWSAVAAMSVARTEHTAMLLPSGRVLVVGGTDGTTTFTSAEVYDPTSDTWSPVAPMAVARRSHAAVDLGNGKYLMVGGLNSSSSPVFGVGNGEVYDPVADVWLPVTPMAVARHKFSAIAIGSGRALIVGGALNHQGVPEFYQ